VSGRLFRGFRKGRPFFWGLSGPDAVTSLFRGDHARCRGMTDEADQGFTLLRNKREDGVISACTRGIGRRELGGL
jgi:hypothetical protein